MKKKKATLVKDPKKKMLKLQEEGKACQLWEAWICIGSTGKKKSPGAMISAKKILKRLEGVATKAEVRFVGWLIPKKLKVDAPRIKRKGKYDLIPWLGLPPKKI